MSDTQQAGVVDALSDTVEVSALLTHDINHVWHVLTTNEGAAAFLGEGATLGGKGEPWRATDGTHGVWRTYHPMEQVRVSWHADENAPRSMVELQLAPDGDKTSVIVRHEHVSGDVEELGARWRSAIARIDALAGD